LYQRTQNTLAKDTVYRRKHKAAVALIIGLLLILIAVFLDMTRDVHNKALAAGFIGSGLIVFSMIPRRGY